MTKDQIRSERSELTEPMETAKPASPGAFLRSLIAAARPPLLQKAFARHLGVSPGTVSDWLRDRHVPRWDHLDLLERLLIEHGVDLEPGLLGSESRPATTSPTPPRRAPSTPTPPLP